MGRVIKCPLNCHLYTYRSVHRQISVQRLTVNQRAQSTKLECSALKETAMSLQPQSLQRNSMCWTWQPHCPWTHRSCDCVYDIYTRPRLPKSKHRWKKSHGALPLAEELLATDGCWGKRVLESVFFKDAVPKRLPMCLTHMHILAVVSRPWV